MAAIHYTHSLHRDTRSKSDIIDIFGPLEDQSPTTRVVRVPRLGYSSTLSRKPTSLSPPMEQSMPTYQELPMWNNTFATMQSGSYGLGRPGDLRREELSSSRPHPPASFPYQTMPAPMPMSANSYVPKDANSASPLQTTFDSGSSNASYLSYDGGPQSATSTRSSFALPSIPPVNRSRKRSDVSSREESESEPLAQMDPSPARRENPSPVTDPASTRERYLEKNRRAATKCRGKQKRQQEELVESARNAERKNKILKVEVELLKEDMRELMQVVGEHSHCTDNRLRMYVQREADRLAAGRGRQSIPRSPDTVRSSGRSSESS